MTASYKQLLVREGCDFSCVQRGFCLALIYVKLNSVLFMGHLGQGAKGVL
jgi:hypothetical protein